MGHVVGVEGGAPSLGTAPAEKLEADIRKPNSGDKTNGDRQGWAKPDAMSTEIAEGQTKGGGHRLRRAAMPDDGSRDCHQQRTRSDTSSWVVTSRVQQPATRLIRTGADQLKKEG